MKPIAHTRASLRSAAEEFLLLLNELDEPDPDGYFRTLPSDTYFAALHNDHPGAWDALVRNMSYGLSHFPDGLVLDVGCGHGLQSFVFARHGHEVIGLDTAENRTVVSNRIAEAAEMPWLHFRTGNARDDLADLRGSALWMHRSFHHIPERTDFDATALRYFKQVHESLEPDGVMVLITSNANSRRLLPWTGPGQHRVNHLTALIERADLEVRDISFHGYLSVLPPTLRPRTSTAIDARIAQVPGVRRLGGHFSIAARRPA